SNRSGARTSARARRAAGATPLRRVSAVSPRAAGDQPSKTASRSSQFWASVHGKRVLLPTAITFIPVATMKSGETPPVGCAGELHETTTTDMMLTEMDWTQCAARRRLTSKRYQIVKRGGYTTLRFHDSANP